MEINCWNAFLCSEDTVTSCVRIKMSSVYSSSKTTCIQASPR